MDAATEADIPNLVSMAESLHGKREARFEFIADDMAAYFLALIQSPAGVIFMTEDGFIAGMVTPAPQNNSWIMAFEIYWWSKGRSGLRLKRAFEGWALNMGANEIKFSHPVEETRVAGILEKSGHVPTEMIYGKAVKCA